MQGKKTSVSDKNKVIEAKLRDPNKSLRDIEKETGVKRDTVSKTIKEIPGLSTKADKDLISRIDNIIDDIAEITEKHARQMKEKKALKSYDVKLLNEISKTNFERKQILTGKPTEIVDMNINCILNEIIG
jgi:DNA-binding MarR family transcriptional regulator